MAFAFLAIGLLLGGGPNDRLAVLSRVGSIYVLLDREYAMYFVESRGLLTNLESDPLAVGSR